jgi:hypothetical protein
MRLILFSTILLITIIFNSSLLFAQNNGTATYSGTVIDSTNGEALIGANVYIKELNYGSSTNLSGYFVIANVPYGEYILICSYIGYNQESYRINVTRDCENCLTIYMNPTAFETEEVIVSGDSIKAIDKLFTKPISQIELTQVQINKIPKFVEADLLRAMQTLPGITALSDFSSALYVRGGTPDQNLYLIDGTDVYNPEHAFGIFSTFNTNAIKKVEMSKGGFGAEYGGRLSSVLNVTNLDGNRNNFEGFVNVSLISASATLQLPLSTFGSISGSIRRTYIDQTYAKWVEDIPTYYFIDGNVKAFFDLGNSDKLTLSFFSGRDDLDFEVDKEAQESLSFLYNWGNTTGSINWKHIFSPKLFASFWLTASRFDSQFDFPAVSVLEENYLSDYAFKAALEYYASNSFILKFGAEQKLIHELYDQSSLEQRVLIDNNRQYTSGYVDGTWKPSQDWDFQAGLRVSLFNADTTFLNFEPRASVKYRLSEESNLKLAGGYYNQYLSRISRLFFSSIWATVNKHNNESSARHLILGYQRAIGRVWEFEVETYYKDYSNIYFFNPYVGADIEPSYYDEQNRPVYGSTKDVFLGGDGRSYGIEFLIRKDLGAITGWVSYTLARTEYNYDEINRGNVFVPRHDRTSVINTVLNIDINNLFNELSGDPPSRSTSSWLFSMNFIYTTGQPLTVPSSGYYQNRLPDWDDLNQSGRGSPGYNLYPVEANSFRLPDYIRMDLSLTWENVFESWSLSPYLQVFNVGYRKNVWFIEYEDELEDGTIVQKIDKVNMLPILPSLGVNIKF